MKQNSMLGKTRQESVEKLCLQAAQQGPDARRARNRRAETYSTRVSGFGSRVSGLDSKLKTRNSKLRKRRWAFFNSLVVLLIFLLPLPAYSHEGDLDSYGCHHDKNRGDYHCHQGEFTGLSFDSKIHMVRLLRLQNLNLGRALPDGPIEEDITSAEVEAKQEPLTTPAEEKKKPEQQIRPAKSKAKEELSLRNEKAQAASKQSKSKPRQSVRVVNIRSDGFVEYEDLRGERFYIDDNGNKVYVRRKR